MPFTQRLLPCSRPQLLRRCGVRRGRGRQQRQVPLDAQLGCGTVHLLEQNRSECANPLQKKTLQSALGGFKS